jgi:hypothetical protein
VEEGYKGDQVVNKLVKLEQHIMSQYPDDIECVFTCVSRGGSMFIAGYEQDNFYVLGCK